MMGPVRSTLRTRVGQYAAPSAQLTRRWWLGLTAVMVLGMSVSASTWHVFGHTWDEPEHIAAGMDLVDRGQYDYDIQHPPLARVMFALGPYLAGARSQGKAPPDGRPEGIALLYGSGHYTLYLTLARAGALPFFALLIAVTFLWARVFLMPREALIAALVVATTPVLIGHAALATLDVPATATCLMSLYALKRWLLHNRLRDAVFVGFATGLAIGTKLSAIPFIGLGFFVLLCLHSVQQHAPNVGGVGHSAVSQRSRRIAGIAAGTLLVIAVLTLAYGGQFIYLTDSAHHYNPALGYVFGYTPGALHDEAYQFFSYVPVPKALQWLVGGVEAVSVHNNTGHLSYLLGQSRTNGWWYFYLVALAVKTPIPLLLCGVSGLIALAISGVRRRVYDDCLPLLLVVTLLMFVSVFSHINIGVRHVLILHPLLAIGSVAGVSGAWQWTRDLKRQRVALLVRAALVALMAWQACMLAVWPDYLAYFNGLAPEPRHVLIDSDLDWGQDFKRLTMRLAERHIEHVALAYQGTADLSREPLPDLKLLQADQVATGWVAITALARMRAPHHFEWLNAYVPVERIGTTIDLYWIPGPSPSRMP